MTSSRVMGGADRFIAGNQPAVSNVEWGASWSGPLFIF